MTTSFRATNYINIYLLKNIVGNELYFSTSIINPEYRIKKAIKATVQMPQTESYSHTFTVPSVIRNSTEIYENAKYF